MKIKSLLTGALALGLASAAQAQVTIDITGATAFRGATHSAIKAAFDAGGSYRYAVDGSTLTGSNSAIFEGTYPGITGTTTVRTAFTGSVEGILSLTKPTVPANQVVYLNSGALVGAAAATPTLTFNATSKDAASQTSKFAFSDVQQASTPAKTPKLFGGPAGVIVFTPLINKGANPLITNITTQQFRQLAAAGRLPERFFTGIDRAANATESWVYLTGRNDLSGTRTAFLAETGYGVSTAVKQYVVRTSNSTASTIDSISLAPTAANTSANLTSSTGIQASAVFTSAGTKEGNGGYNSGSKIGAFMKWTSSSTSVVNSSTLAQVSAPAQIALVTWIGTGDAVSSMTINTTTGVPAGANNLSYNGEKLDLKWQPTGSGTYSTGLSPSDRAKIRNGKYTAWSYENLYYKTTAAPTGDDLTFYNDLKSRLTPTLIASSGLALSEMKLPVDPAASPLVGSATDASKRTTDGGIVAP